MKKLLMAILAILTIATGMTEARRGGGGRGGRGGRGMRGRGGRGRRGGWGRGRGWRRGWGRGYWAPSFYLGSPWYSPYSYERDVVYVQQPESELTKLTNRLNGLLEAQQAKIAQGNRQMVASFQREIDSLRVRINKLTGVPSALAQQQAFAQQQKMIAELQQTIAQQQQAFAQKQAAAKTKALAQPAVPAA